VTSSIPSSRPPSQIQSAARHPEGVGSGRDALQSEGGFPQGAEGLMQLMPDTAKGLGVDPFAAPQAIDGAGRLWAQNLKASGGDIDRAAMMYHGGPDTRQWGPKTHAYPQKLAAALGPTAQPQQGGGDPIEAALSGQAPAPSSQALRSRPILTTRLKARLRVWTGPHRRDRCGSGSSSEAASSRRRSGRNQDAHRPQSANGSRRT
jgi:hypothetical protein